MAAETSTGLQETLGRKVGPLPLWAWLAAGGGLVWYLRSKQSASSAAATPAAAQSTTGYGTDPAGNVGYIDPQTGYVYGSAEDISALQNQGLVASNTYAGTGGDTSGGGSTADTGAGTTDTSGQTTGTTTASGTSTTTPGAPAGPTTATPGAAAPKSNSWQYPAPASLTFPDVTDTGFGVTFSPVTGPSGQKPGTYTVQTWQGNTKVDQFVSGSTSTREYGSGGKGLKPATTYRVDVWANGGPVAPPHATGTVTTKPKGG